jgi:hypothetical protein
MLGITAGFCGGPAFAADLDPNARSKAIAAATPQSAPAAAPSRVNLPDLHGGIDTSGRGLTGACDAAKADLCYDYREGRIVYSGTKQWMPEFSGLTPEHISVRKDRINFRYSFR